MAVSVMEKVLLNDGNYMPNIGVGLFQIPDLAVAEKVVLDALDIGYRMIDTAAAYYNETAVGAAIKKSGIARDEIFITSKLWVDHVSYEKAKLGIDESLNNLGVDYLDLYLIH